MNTIKIDTSAAQKAAEQAHATAASTQKAAEAAIAATQAAADRIRNMPKTTDPQEFDKLLASAIRGN